MPLRSCVLLSVMLISGPAWADFKKDSPKPVDPFTGISDKSLFTPTNATTLPDFQNMKVAVLLTENTRQQMAWTEERREGYTGLDRMLIGAYNVDGVVMSADQLHELGYDPKPVTDGLMEPLIRKAAAVRIINSMDEFRQSDDDLLVLMDVVFINEVMVSPVTIGSICNLGMDIQLFVIDREARMTTAQTHYMKKHGLMQCLKSVGPSRQAALRQYRGTADSLFGPDRPATVAAPDAGSPALSASSAPPAASPLDRLATLDEALKRGLITPEEHASKRAEILSSM
ncbi:MAG: SHOCT domain-containing protein [Burkholderiales bacterium]|nr:SHOCT domain-containing protein [Burkholderiales bacterium]